MYRLPFSVVTSVLILVSSLYQIAQATTVRPLSFEEIVRSATEFCAFEVLKKQSIARPSAVYTRYELSVIHCFKGSLAPEERIHLEVLGGKSVPSQGPSKVTLVPGIPQLNQGERHLLSVKLNEASAPEEPIYSLEQWNNQPVTMVQEKDASGHSHARYALQLSPARKSRIKGATDSPSFLAMLLGASTSSPGQMSFEEFQRRVDEALKP